MREYATLIVLGILAVFAMLISLQLFYATRRPDARKNSFSWAHMLRTKPIRERSRRELTIQAWTGVLAALGCAAYIAWALWQR